MQSRLQKIACQTIFFWCNYCRRGIRSVLWHHGLKSLHIMKMSSRCEDYISNDPHSLELWGPTIFAQKSVVFLLFDS